MAERGARTVWLPSGRRVRVRRGERRAGARRTEKTLFAETLDALTSGGVVVEDAASGARLDAAAIDALVLPDFHVLRDWAIRAHAVPAEREEIPCDNCDATLALDPARLPLVDLDDRYEDEAFERTLELTLPEPVGTGGRTASRARLSVRTVAEARPLWRQLAKDRAFRITPKLIEAMGVTALEGEGVRVTDRRELARALDAASDEAWAAIEDGFLALAYPPRAITPLACASCGTMHDLEVPWPRELAPWQYEAPRDPTAPFPDAEAFGAHVARVAKHVFATMGCPGLTLRVHDGVPEVDDGGTPMLGSYAPEPSEEGRTDFVVTIYYRTFARAFRDDPRFDWEHEVRETLEHEVEHHLYYLSGHDPMDEAERAQIDQENERRAGGPKRHRQLVVRAMARDVWEIVRTLGPLLALVALASVLVMQCAR